MEYKIYLAAQAEGVQDLSCAALVQDKSCIPVDTFAAKRLPLHDKDFAHPT